MSSIHWFEIGVDDIERAAAFYGQVLDTTLSVMDLTATQGTVLAMLPGRGGAGGALVYGPDQGYKPSLVGTLLYLVVDGDLNVVLARAEAAGGETLLGRTPMGPEAGGGAVAWIKDSEGNKVGLYSAETTPDNA